MGYYSLNILDVLHTCMWLRVVPTKCIIDCTYSNQARWSLPREGLPPRWPSPSSSWLAWFQQPPKIVLFWRTRYIWLLMNCKCVFFLFSKQSKGNFLPGTNTRRHRERVLHGIPAALFRWAREYRLPPCPDALASKGLGSRVRAVERFLKRIIIHNSEMWVGKKIFLL